MSVYARARASVGCRGRGGVGRGRLVASVSAGARRVLRLAAEGRHLPPRIHGMSGAGISRNAVQANVLFYDTGLPGLVSNGTASFDFGSSHCCSNQASSAAQQGSEKQTSNICKRRLRIAATQRISRCTRPWGKAKLAHHPAAAISGVAQTWRQCSSSSLPQPWPPRVAPSSSRGPQPRTREKRGCTAANGKSSA